MDTTATLIQMLEKSTSLDCNELQATEIYLKHSAQNDFTTFIKILSDILVQEGNSNVAKMAAGLQLKNYLTSHDPALKEQYQQRWLALPADVKCYIKKNILTALGTENNRPSSAAQCIAYLAIVELPLGEWGDLIPTLTGNINDNSTELTKEATFEVLGYISKDVDAEVLKESINQILTAIVHGMRSSEPSKRVRVAATKVLLNLLELTKTNFEIENERNFIMDVICQATQSSDIGIIVAALQCLVKVARLYYQHMESYMEHALLPISINAIKSEVDDIALQGINFWYHIIQKEIDLEAEAAAAARTGQPHMGTSKFYVRSVLHRLAPALIQKLNKEYDSDFELEWSPPKAASMCLMVLSKSYEEEVVSYMFPFIDSKVKNNNWRYREAASEAFDTVYGGVPPNVLEFFM